MEIQYRVLGAIGTNVYFLINKETKETLLVDPADNAPYLLEQIKMRGYDMKAILLTHGHFDHIYAVNDLKKSLDVPVYAYADEAALMGDSWMNRSKAWAEAMTVTPDILLHDGDELDLAGFHIRVIHTPGHTAGSCCYYPCSMSPMGAPIWTPAVKPQLCAPCASSCSFFRTMWRFIPDTAIPPRSVTRRSIIRLPFKRARGTT